MQKLKFLAPALPLTVICVVIALLLSLINALTADRIVKNALEEKALAIEDIVPSSKGFESADSSLYAKTVKEAGRVKNESGETIGYYAEVSPVGFKGEISLIIGCNIEGRILRVSCLATSETPSVGTKATDVGYLVNFANKDKTDVDAVDTISGATISSRAVKSGIKNAVITISNIIEEGK